MNTASMQGNVVAAGIVQGITPAPVDFIIEYAAGGVPTWMYDGKNSGLCHARDNALVNFKFQCKDSIASSIVQAVLMVGPRRPSSSPSPFGAERTIMLQPGKPLSILPSARGTWGISITFMTSDGAGNTSFYFVPDPELAVGSHGNDE